MKTKKIIVFDFDGVIHSYTSGWQGTEVIPDQPVEGIVELLETLKEDFVIYIVSSRCTSLEGRNAIAKYMGVHNLYCDVIQAEKPPAFLTVDDRAITFKGDWWETLQAIKNFKTWQQEGK